MYKQTMLRLMQIGIICLSFVIPLCAKSFSKIAYFDYAYISKKGICVYSITENKEVLIAKSGENPQLSPDGTKLAYTFSPTSQSRNILVVNLLTGKRDTLRTHSTNCYGPIWSPDGTKIAFNVFINDVWYVGIANGVGSVTNISKSIKTTPGNFNPTWSRDGELIFAHDMHTVYAFDMQGKIVSKTPVTNYLKSPNFSSADKFQWLTADSLIIETDLANKQFYMGLHRALILFDKKTNKAHVLTPKDYSCNNFFVSKGFIYMDGIKAGAAAKNIYRVDYTGNNFKLFKSYCHDFSSRIK